jgi:heme/copper-type cytochrome/quinol oxidase subunit 4
MTAATPAPLPRDGHRLGATVLGFLGLVAVTVAELMVVGGGLAGAARVTALVGLLLAKVGLVLTLFLRARARRRDSRLALAALLLAAGYAVVLALEAAFRMRQR